MTITYLRKLNEEGQSLLLKCDKVEATAKGYKMIGSFITRGLVLIFGYAFPAYECYKSVEMNKPDIHQLRFWCQYWILVAGLTICERIGDLFISWVPMYGEAKLALFIYLWFPKTKGTTYVYDSFFRPYVAKHEPEIDRNLIELRTRAGDIALSYSQKAAIYAQTSFFDILQYIATQSTTKKRAQSQNQSPIVEKSIAASDERPAPTGKSKYEQTSSSHSSSTSSSGHQEDIKKTSETSDNVKLSPTPVRAPAPASSNESKTTLQSSKSLNSKGELPASVEVKAQPSLQDIINEESGRVTRARSKRTRDATIRSAPNFQTISVSNFLTPTSLDTSNKNETTLRMESYTGYGIYQQSQPSKIVRLTTM